MDFVLSKEHQHLQEMYREFAQTHVKPIARDCDEKEEFPAATVKMMQEKGFFGIPFPKELGGQGGDVLSFALCTEEIAKVDATHPACLSTNVTLVAAPIFEKGTDEQKKKYLVPLASGQKLGSFGLTEPNAGTDAAMQETVAVLQGDKYILNGKKRFITNAAYAQTFLIIAMTDKSKGTKGCTAFLVERDFPGFSVAPPEKKLGIRASSTCELILENCEVPKENMLGSEGEGFKIAMRALDGGRIGIAAQALGIAAGALDLTIEYVNQRKQFGQFISQFQNTRFELADMLTKVDAARLLVYRAACAQDAGIPHGQYAAMAKYYASTVASDVARRCVQLFGGNGFIRDYNIERYMRDAKITEIYEGTSEVQRMVISAGMGLK